MSRPVVDRPRVATVAVEGPEPTPGVAPDGPRPAPAAAPPPGFGPPPARDRLRGWVVTGLLALLAGVLRFADLGTITDAGTPVFDEKHYVPQAWQMLRNGGVEDNPGYELIVHPPLGKQLIALGEQLFGYTPFGWRAAAAAAGVLTVVLIVRAGRRLTRSTLLGAVAGILLICDGLSHVQTRMGMLDAFSALFVVAAFATMLVDRDEVRARLAIVLEQGRIADSPYGPRLGVRWWRLATGALLGLGCAVKWSGVYWLAAFAVLIVLWDVTARRSAGVERPWRGTLVRDVGPALWALAVVPVLAYLASWWAWFGSETGTDRYSAGDPLSSLLAYSRHVLGFHAGLTTAASGEHPWESKPWSWPMGLRPMLYSITSGEQVDGCGAAECVRAVMLLGTPALWWPAYVVLAYALWRTVARFDWRFAAVLVGYGAGILPWFVNIDRQMYLFYMTPAVPFLVLATVLAMGEVLGRVGASRERRQTGLLVVGLWVGLVVANFVWMWPILQGLPVTTELWNAQLWLPSWRANG